MKKGALLILLVLILPFISAVEVEMKTNFSQGETLMAKVSGNFLDTILKENIYFYRGHVRAPTDYDLAKIKGEYYIYALLSNKVQENYSMVIKDVHYMQGSQVSDEEIVKEFSINENTADFSVKPGFIFSSEDYFVEVQNLQNSKITINAKVLVKNETSEEPGFLASLFGISSGEAEQEKSVTLLSGEIKKINFEIGDLNESKLKTIELSTNNLIYKIPAYLFVQGEIEQEEDKEDFEFEPHYMNVSLSANSESKRIVKLENIGDVDIENISLSLSESLQSYANLSIENISKFDENSSTEIEISFFSEDAATIEGYVKAQTSDKLISVYLEIDLVFIADYVAPENEIPLTQTCAEKNGTVCEKDEECSIDTTKTNDAVCCLGECREKKKSPAGAIIGWGMIILTVSFLVWFFIKRYNKANVDVDLLKIARGKKPEFISPQKKNIVPRTITRVIEKPVLKIVEKPVIREVEKPKPIIPKYVSSSQTNTYHKSSCKFAGLIKKDYKMSNDDLNFFKKLGYKPCKSCFK